MDLGSIWTWNLYWSLSIWTLNILDLEYWDLEDIWTLNILDVEHMDLEFIRC